MVGTERNLVRSLILVLLLLCGCSLPAGEYEKQILQKYVEKTSPKGRLTVVDGPFEIGDSYLWLVKDSLSQQEFLLAIYRDSPAICPISAKK